jgi:plastocyanin
MLRIKSTTFGLACGLALALALPAGADACERQDHRPILVSVADDGTPEVDTDSLTVCAGDTVRWVFKGSPRDFSIIFASLAESPFEWDRLTGSTITATVRADAAKAGQTTPYKYDVQVDGKKLDPKIIVVP